VAPITSTALSSVPQALSGIASGVNNTVSRVGSLLAVGLIGILIGAVFSSHAPHSTLHPLAETPTSAVTRSASVDAFRAGMLLCAAFALGGALVGALRISDAEALAAEAGTASPA